MTEREFKVVVATTMHYVRSNHNVELSPNHKICDEVRKLLPDFSDYVKIGGGLNITEERLCSQEVSKLLGEKGFDIPCGHWFYFYECRIWQPTHQMACDWLRKREKIAYNILIIADGGLGDLHYSYEIQEIDNEFLQVNGSLDIESQEFDTSEEAVEAALKYSLENLI